MSQFVYYFISKLTPSKENRPDESFQNGLD